MRRRWTETMTAGLGLDLRLTVTQEEVAEFLARYLPGAVGPELVSRTCVYDLTADRNFILDTIPATRGSACSSAPAMPRSSPA